jgi:PIN like domain
VRIVFDENTPPAVAYAVRVLAEADNAGSELTIEVRHAREFVGRGAHDVPLIQAVGDGAHAPSVLVTTDKAMRTRQHERAAFVDTGCIGIVLRGQWNHASLWDRARLTLVWWTTWVAQARETRPGSLLQCPWSERPKRLKDF